MQKNVYMITNLRLMLFCLSVLSAVLSSLDSWQCDSEKNSSEKIQKRRE